MQYKKIQFSGSSGALLSARLDFPPDRHPIAWAVMAHGFTLSKDLSAMRNITRTLNMEGFAVLRFDFTGLGESEGDFSEMNFSSNIEDIVAAAQYLTAHFFAPSLLVGHSLGGAAVIFAASKIPSVRAVATIGAPSCAEHVLRLFGGKLDDIEHKGYAVVRIGPRSFMIKKQFLDDIRQHNMDRALNELDVPILIIHSPADEIVPVSNAAEIYKAARHPKSFISVPGANHLLSNKKHSLYVGGVIAQWAGLYIEAPAEPSINPRGKVVAYLDDEGYDTQVRMRQHGLIVDEPETYGGNDFGPTPYELLSAALAACTDITLMMYARRKEWPLEAVRTYVNYRREHCEDCENLDGNPMQNVFYKSLDFEGELSEAQIKRLLQIAAKCPVHKTLQQSSVIHTEWVDYED